MRQQLQQLISPGLELRSQYMREKPLKINSFEQQYITKLKYLGIKTLQGLYPAYFTLKNGLEYIGMATSNQIPQAATLVTVPENLILSSITALRQPKLKSVFEQPFYNQKDSWEYRVLVTYTLFLNDTKPPNNIFVEMIDHMSKQIDLAFIWNEQEINLLIDKTLKKTIQSDIKRFEAQWKQFEEIQRKHQIIQSEGCNKSNYLWLYIHGETRTFSSKLKFLSYVPLCQFFNHHSCSVYYDIDMSKQKQSLPAQRDNQNQSSDGSNESELQNISDDQFAYNEVQWRDYHFERQLKSSQKEEEEKIQQLSANLLEKIEGQLDWKDFTIIFVGNLINYVQLAKKDYVMGKTGYINHWLPQDARKSTLKLKLGMKTLYKVENIKKGQQKTEEEFVRPDPSKILSSYTQLYLKNSNKDKIPENNQVYFRYGKKSNRHLLLRYGFAIEGNKYQHVWLSFCLKDQLKQFIGLEQKFKNFGLSLRRKFKINYCSLNLSLIIFFRLKAWRLTDLSSIESIFYINNFAREMKVLSEIKCALIQQLQPYKNISQSDLTNPKFNYHQYFICVFNLEKKRIIQKQVFLFEKLIQILGLLQQGESIERAINLIKGVQRFILRPYLQCLKVSIF